MNNKDITKELETDYPLIPMSKITDEARMIAVRWAEAGDREWIGQKHKLASDIMNYARRNSLERIAELEKEVEFWKQKLANIIIEEENENQEP